MHGEPWRCRRNGTFRILWHDLPPGCNVWAGHRVPDEPRMARIVLLVLSVSSVKSVVLASLLPALMLKSHKES